jgi:hypothetical protein
MLAHEALAPAAMAAGWNTAAIPTAARDATSNRFVMAF